MGALRFGAALAPPRLDEVRGNAMKRLVGIVGLVLGPLLVWLAAAARTPEVAPAGEPTGAVCASRHVGRGGGVLAASRVRVVVPRGALAKDETIRIGRRGLPAPFPRGVKPASEVVVLTKDSKARFRRPVSVTIPYSPEAVGATVPVPFYWNVERQAYVDLTLTAIDRTAHTVTFRTLHFTDFVVGALDPTPSLDVDTGYRPGTDGWSFVNYGALDDGGNCAGMVLSEIAYFDHNRGSTTPAPPLASVSDTLTDPSIELVTEAQSVAGALPPAAIAPVGSAQAALQLLTAMKTTGDPQSLFLYGTANGVHWGHAVTVFGYEDGHFLLNDPNFPGHTIWYGFDPDTGSFGAYLLDGTQPTSPTGSATDAISTVGLLSADEYDSVTSWPEAEQFELEANADTRFDSIALTTAIVSSGAVVSGTAASTDPATLFDVLVNGEDLGYRELDANHGFSYTVASSLLGPGNTTVEVELTGSDGSYYGGGSVVLGPGGAPLGAGPTDLAAFLPPPPPPPPAPPPPGAITITYPSVASPAVLAYGPGASFPLDWNAGPGPGPTEVDVSILAQDGHAVATYETHEPDPSDEVGTAWQTCPIDLTGLAGGNYTIVASPSNNGTRGPTTSLAFEIVEGTPCALTFLTPAAGATIAAILSELTDVGPAMLADVTLTWSVTHPELCRQVSLSMVRLGVTGESPTMCLSGQPVVLDGQTTSRDLGAFGIGTYVITATTSNALGPPAPPTSVTFTIVAPATLPTGWITFRSPAQGTSVVAGDVVATFSVTNPAVCQNIVLSVTAAAPSYQEFAAASLDGQATSWDMGTLPPGIYHLDAYTILPDIGGTTRAGPGNEVTFIVTAPADDAGLPLPSRTSSGQPMVRATAGGPAPRGSAPTASASAPPETIGIVGALRGATGP
jgi:hypothetical protein